MLTVEASPQRLCDGLSRRAFLRVGALGGLGLALPGLLQGRSLRAAEDGSFGRAKRCVVVFLTGGPPQLDTWDMKAGAPAEVRGELRAIGTKVGGIEICELLPRLARHTDKLCIVRSVTHGDQVHTSAGYTMLTGAYHPSPNQASAALVGPQPNDHPHLGAVVAKVQGWRGGMPPFVAVPEVIKDAGTNEFPGQGGGFLGNPYGPFLVEADVQAASLTMPGIRLPKGMTAERLEDRRVLLERVNQRFRGVEAGRTLDDLDGFYQKAFAMIGSQQARRAFELDREPAKLREAYGKHLFGQGCLLARRLLEAGVRLVTVYWHYEGPYDSPVWDTHWNNFRHLRARLMPPTDAALSALLSDLSERGMLDDTLVLCMGEFGRTPKINAKAGRDHWPHVQSILLAGAGIAGGSVYGTSDRLGAYPADKPVSPPDLAATVLHLLGIPPRTHFEDLFGKPTPVTTGAPVEALIG